MHKVFVIGSINSDFVIHAPYLPAKGETLTGGGFSVVRGGKGANQAVAAARSGADVVMCARVGEDSFGKEATACLEREGICVSAIQIEKNAVTGSAVIVVIDGDNRIILDRGANACLSLADVEYALYGAQEGDVLLVQLENPVETIGYALKRGRELGMRVILNPAPATREILPYLKYCDLVVPNETEAEILGGAEALLKYGCEVIVTLGGEGFAYYRGGEVQKVGCMKVKVVDTTGAGDTFCGALCARLAEGEDVLNAAIYGGKAGSIACMRAGAQPSIPTRREVENYKA